MPVNDFLPFGLGVGANVLATADWASDSERVMGFERGLAKSIKANTAWRHCSFVTAGVAFLVSEALDEDVLDNGDLPGFIDQLRRAIIDVTGGPDAPDDGNIYVRMYRRWVLGDDFYLALLGGTMQGFITLHQPPVLPMHAANKQYIDDAISDLLTYLQGNYLPLDGGQMRGFISLHSPPTQPMHAANKQYIDDAINNLRDFLVGNYLHLSGGTMQGYITLHAYPVNPMHAAPKGYVDDTINNRLTGYLPLVGGTLYRPGGSDILQLLADNGRHARITYHVGGQRIWTAGVLNDGCWAIIDESGGAYRMRACPWQAVELWAPPGGSIAVVQYGGLDVQWGNAWIRTNLWVEDRITATHIHTGHWIVNCEGFQGTPALCGTISSPYFWGIDYYARNSIRADGYISAPDVHVGNRLYVRGTEQPRSLGGIAFAPGGYAYVSFWPSFSNIQGASATMLGPNWLSETTIGNISGGGMEVHIRQDAGYGPGVSAWFSWTAVGT